MRVTLVGHTDHSLEHFPIGIGEIPNTAILTRFLQEMGYELKVYDAHQLTPSYDPGDVQILLTHPTKLWELQKFTHNVPTITRIYAFDDFSWINPHLHLDSTLCITQNIIANRLGLQQGLQADQMFYIPYQALNRPASNKSELKRQYLQRVAPHVDSNSVLVGCAMRLQAGKNGDFLLDAFEAIRDQVPEALLVIRGDLDPRADLRDCIGYCERMEERLQAPWVIWDRTHYRSHEEHLRILQAFDVGVHPTGSDDPANAICEQLAIGIPMLLLAGGPRDSLFRDAALFVEHQGHHRLRHHWSSFFIPKRADFAAKLLRLIKEEPLRKELAEKGSRIAYQRFGADLTRRKLPLLIEGAYHIHHDTPQAPSYRQKIRDAWVDDHKLFGEPLCVSR
jgi:glycosyltransferase involved in cell wall biosynthesis